MRYGRIGLAINGNAELEVTLRALKSFKRGVCEANGFDDAFFEAMDEWEKGVGFHMEKDVEHDDARLFVRLTPKEYQRWCGEVGRAWHDALKAEAGKAVVDLSAAVQAGIEAGLAGVGLTVVVDEDEQRKEKAAAEQQRTGKGRFAHPAPASAKNPVPKAIIHKQGKKAAKAKASPQTAVKPAAAVGLNGHGHVNGAAAHA
jgi:hypothetical protein